MMSRDVRELWTFCGECACQFLDAISADIFYFRIAVSNDRLVASIWLARPVTMIELSMAYTHTVSLVNDCAASFLRFSC